jgi:isochorismate synthase
MDKYEYLRSEQMASLTAFDVANPQAVFMSAHRQVHGYGISERITLPVHTHTQSDVCFQQSVSAALMRARERGVANPVIMGAIPFDLRQATSLVVPEVCVLTGDVTSYRSGENKELAALKMVTMRSTPDKHRFKQAVQQAIANFHLSDIRKVVLSRILEITTPTKLSGAEIFSRLVMQNSRGFHFRMPVAEGGELVGSSPELLVRKHAGKIYSNPLAGSAKRHVNSVLDMGLGKQLLCSEKDLYEHRLVVEEIRVVLTSICSQLDIPAGPSLMNTAAMWHLSTSLNGVLSDPSMSALQVACLLHPTPAVCGHPTKMARKLINLIEPFDRGYFSGMVGWCDAQGNGEWAVTIRCGLVRENSIRLFAGAGIVAESQPESEWLETQAKLQTMLNALGLDLAEIENQTCFDEVAA